MTYGFVITYRAPGSAICAGCNPPGNNLLHDALALGFNESRLHEPHPRFRDDEFLGFIPPESGSS